ncbi:MAG: asparagine synthase-related protein, partial [Candidatus Binataceae bacterium]
LEVRAPILDHVFAEWATGLPPDWKLRNGEQKYILKKLAERVGVPRSVIYRPKKGFGVPLVHWFRNELKESLLSMLLEPQTLQRGYFNPRVIRQLIDEHQRCRRDRSSDLWILLVCELWHRNFLSQSAPSSSSEFSPSVHRVASSRNVSPVQTKPKVSHAIQK